jgi:hypothetical protein
MKMALFMLLGVLASAVPSVSQVAATESTLSLPEVRGRIVRFDWGGHWSNVNEDLVVRVLPDAKSIRRYVRVTYQAGGGEAPVNAKDILPFSAFVGRGPVWIFRVKKPLTTQEKYSCGRVNPDIPVEEDSGKVVVPRYIPTPGAENEPVPPIETLPCFVLDRGGLKLAQIH